MVDNNMASPARTPARVDVVGPAGPNRGYIASPSGAETEILFFPIFRGWRKPPLERLISLRGGRSLITGAAAGPA